MKEGDFVFLLIVADQIDILNVFSYHRYDFAWCMHVRLTIATEPVLAVCIKSPFNFTCLVVYNDAIFFKFFPAISA